MKVNTSLYSKAIKLVAVIMFCMFSKIASSQIITTVAGNGILGYSGDGGIATSASLANPAGLAVDGLGNIYIADASNNVIRKVNTNGVISTIAGNGKNGTIGDGDGGAASNANLWYPYGLAVDPAGNIFIADYLHSRIRKINTSGVISTVAGNGTVGYSGDGGAAINASLLYPTGVAVDTAGNIFIADKDNYR